MQLGKTTTQPFRAKMYVLDHPVDCSINQTPCGIEYEIEVTYDATVAQKVRQSLQNEEGITVLDEHGRTEIYIQDTNFELAWHDNNETLSVYALGEHNGDLDSLLPQLSDSYELLNEVFPDLDLDGYSLVQEFKSAAQEDNLSDNDLLLKKFEIVSNDALRPLLSYEIKTLTDYMGNFTQHTSSYMHSEKYEEALYSGWRAQIVHDFLMKYMPRDDRYIDMRCEIDLAQLTIIYNIGFAAATLAHHAGDYDLSERFILRAKNALEGYRPNIDNSAAIISDVIEEDDLSDSEDVPGIFLDKLDVLSADNRTMAGLDWQPQLRATLVELTLEELLQVNRDDPMHTWRTRQIEQKLVNRSSSDPVDWERAYFPIVTGMQNIERAGRIEMVTMKN